MARDGFDPTLWSYWGRFAGFTTFYHIKIGNLMCPEKPPIEIANLPKFRMDNGENPVAAVVSCWPTSPGHHHWGVEDAEWWNRTSPPAGCHPASPPRVPGVPGPADDFNGKGKLWEIETKKKHHLMIMGTSMEFLVKTCFPKKPIDWFRRTIVWLWTKTTDFPEI